MLVGSVLGVLFVSLVRRMLVEDPELPFPESVAASQIHKAGQVGAQAAKFLFYNMAFGSAVFLGGRFQLFRHGQGLAVPGRSVEEELPCVWARRARPIRWQPVA